MYNLWDNGCESYVYKPCVAHGKGMVYMSPIVTPTITWCNSTGNFYFFHQYKRLMSKIAKISKNFELSQNFENF